VTPRLSNVLVYGLSVVVLAVVISATAAFALGVRTTFGTGIAPSLGKQIERDFLADQDAEAAALSGGDPSPIGGRLTGNALVDVSQQISNQSAAGPAPSVSFQPASLSIVRAQDPTDPSLVSEVIEDGTKSVTSAAGPNAAPTQQAIAFHGEFWLRQDSSGRYLIADQNIQNQPASNLGAWALIAVAVAWVSIAAWLVARLRARAIPASLAAALPETTAAALEAPVDDPPFEAETGPPARVVIRTFGGLHVHQDGRDWAAALRARSVTAFIWLRLLVAAIKDPNSGQPRDELGRQASPGLDRETQLKQMRNLTHQGLPELPAALRERIVVEPQVMRFSFDGCAVDALDLLAACVACAGRSRLTNAQSARAQRALEATAGTFLPEFETIEDIATDRHPTCTEMIREQREWLAGKRLELILVLADSYLAGRRPAQAIAILEPAFQERPERGDLRARLATAYSRSGRHPEAAALEVQPGPSPIADVVTVPPK